MSSEHQDLCEATSSWLTYKSLTGLRTLLNEGSMAVPIAEFLAARHGSEIDAEVAHPLFHAKGRGRPRQLDFVRKKRGDNTWHAAYECKFGNDTFQRAINDICRLVCLSQVKNIGNPARLFVVAGRFDDPEMLLNRNYNPGNGPRRLFFENILSMKDEEPEMKFRISETAPAQKKMFNEFMRSHGASLPAIIRLRRLGLSRVGDFGCAIWEVLAVRGAGMITYTEMQT